MAKTDVRSAVRLQYRRPAHIPFPIAGLYTPDKVEIGRKLFFDTRLSRSGTSSCASCHEPDLAWGDGRARAVGDDGRVLALRSPTLLNLAWGGAMGWDGKFANLEAVTFAAITGASMGFPEAEAIAKISDDPDYRAAFAKAFPRDGISKDTIQSAIATFERTIVSGEAPFDRWIEGDEDAIGPAAKRGMALFIGKAGCSGCHEGWNFTDGSYHDIGSAVGADIGRGSLVPNSPRLRYAFKVPSLRDVARRAPYMHDGSIATLRQVVDLYDRGGIDRPSRSPVIRPLGLTEAQKSDIEDFLRTLTADRATVAMPAPPPIRAAIAEGAHEE